MSLTIDEVEAIFKRPEAKYRNNRESAVVHTFSEGYVMLSSLAKARLPEQLGIDIRDDGLSTIYTFLVDDLPDLAEEHVKELGRMGWHVDKETGRLAYFIIHHQRRTT